MKVIVEHSQKNAELFRIGNVVTSKYTDTVVLIVGAEGKTFRGLIMESATKSRIGEYEVGIQKDGFVQFTGTITIEL